MIETLVDSFEIWGTAQTQKSLGKKAGIDNISLHGINRLRELILELAVRGKLVPQNSNDEPANILFDKIKKEKKRLIAEQEIKRTKQLPEIAAEEIPFKLPNGWMFARLNDLGDWGAGATPLRNKIEYYNGTIPWFKSGELIADYISESEESVTELALKETSLRYNKPGDVLIAMYGATIGKTSILNVPGTTNQAVCACTPFTGFANIYLLTLLKAYKRRFIEMGAGGAQPNISREKIIAIVVALPPLAEQHRIVAKVDELMTLCDKLEQQQMNHIETHLKLVQALLQTLTDATNAEELKAAWQHLEPHFDLLFTTEESIDLLKLTILQLAVMGKLVPQNPNDEPASVLLQKIEAEKNKLIKEGKLKKQNPLPEITDDEKPFELPVGWEFVRLGETISLKSGQDLTPSEYSDTEEIGLPYITGASNLENEKVLINRWTNSPKSIAVKGELLLTCKGSGVGKMGWLHVEEAHIARQIMALSAIISDLNYIKIILEAKLSYIKSSANGLIPGIDRKTVLEMICTLPPVNEQQRIVAKVEELMTLCDQLKERIVASQEIKVKLADAVVERAVNTAPQKDYEIKDSLNIAAEPGKE